MEAFEALFTRRAVREYLPEPVTDAQVEQILRAAMFAPSACNQQPWHFIVIDRREQLNALANVHPYAQMLRSAPLAIIVCVDRTLDTCHGFWPMDGAAATENLLLAARALGLGTVWVGVYPSEERTQSVCQALSLPSFISPVSLVAVGHPAGPLPEVERFKPERIHHNAW